MRILTLVRQVPDAETTLRTLENRIVLDQTQLVMDTMDEYGVEQALRLRESGSGMEVIALAVGPARNEDVLRNALALGADRAIHVVSELALDPIALSSVISAIAGTETVELIFCGGRESDWDSEALGGAVAERLGWPQLTWTTELRLDGDQLSGRHDTDAGSEGFKVTLPAVVTTQQGLNEPRFPTLPNIVKARKKEMRIEKIDQYGAEPLVRTDRTELQPSARRREITLVGDDPSAAATKLAELLKSQIEGLA